MQRTFLKPRVIPIWLVITLVTGCVSTQQQRSITPQSNRSPLDTVTNTAGQQAILHFLRGQLYFEDNNWAEAYDEYSLVLLYDPGATRARIRGAEALIKLGRMDAALQDVMAALDREPNQTDALLLLARIQTTQNRYELAASTYLQLLAQDAKNTDVLIKLGGLYLDLGEVAPANAMFDQAVRIDPSNLLGHYFLGRIELQHENYEQAIAEFRECLEIEPDFFYASLHLANAYELKEDSAAAIAIYDQVLLQQPTDQRVRNRLANLLHLNGQFDRAILEYQSLIRSNPKNIGYRWSIVLLLIERTEYTSALDHLTAIKSMVVRSSDRNKFHYYYGAVLAELHDYPQAVSELQTVPAKSIYFTPAQLALAHAHQTMGSNERAIESLQAAIQDRPDASPLYATLASAYEATSHFDDAVLTLKSGLRVVPTDDSMAFQLATILERMGQEDDSVRMMQKVVEINPDHAEALNYLAYSLAEHGTRLKEAESLIQRAIKIRPDNGYFSDSLGWIHYRAGRYSLAVKHLEHAAELTPNEPIIREHLADAYIKNDQYDQAFAQYKDALLLYQQSQQTSDSSRVEKKLHELRSRLSRAARR